MVRSFVYTLTRYFASLLAFIIFTFLNEDKKYSAISAWANAFNSPSNQTWCAPHGNVMRFDSRLFRQVSMREEKYIYFIETRVH